MSLMIGPPPAIPLDVRPGEQPRSGPQTLSWDGQPQGWWSRNGATALWGGLTALAVGGLGAGIVSSLQPRNLPLAIGGVAAAAIGVGAITSAIVNGVRRSNDKLPAPPSGDAPTLPQPTPLAEVAFGELARGSHEAHASGSYRERVAVTKTRTNSKGETETYTDYEYRTRHFSWDIGIDSQVGRRDGYASANEALDDIVRGDAVAIRQQEGRYVAYDLQARSHWGDVDRLDVADPATVAIVSPSGTVWRRDGIGDRFRRDGTRIERPDPTRIYGASIGEHAIRYRSNPDVTVGMTYTGRRGHELLETALGEMRGRPGEQAVIRTDGRYHVADVHASKLDRTLPNDGFLATGNATDVVAVEREGGIWSPLGAWYVAPEQPAG